jgi:LysM repeat protein
MRRFAFWFLAGTLATSGIHAQDAATQQEIDKLSGQLQDIVEAEAAQGKRLDALEHDLADLRDKVNAPAVNNFASADDLQKLAQQVREIDRKRQEDRDLILRKIEDLAKIAAAPAPAHHHAAASVKDDNSATGSTAPADATPQKGYEYPVQDGDTLSSIARAYREKGVKVTTSQIMKANPGLSPNTLYVGKTIFIPDPNAK